MMKLPLAVLGVCVSLFLLVGCDKPNADDGGKSGSKPNEMLHAELQKLLDGIPKESQPRTDEDGQIDRNKANQWLKENVVGKPVRLTAEVGYVLVYPKEKTYNVHVTFGKLLFPEAEVKMPGGILLAAYGNAGRVRCGSAEWAVLLHAHSWSDLDEASAVRLRDLKMGKRVPLAGTIKSCEFGHGHVVGGPKYANPWLELDLKDTTVDGVAPGKSDVKK